MILILEVKNQKKRPLPKPLVAEFNRKGGSIGRLPKNDLVLLSDDVSRHHASISFENQTFFFCDRSLNGTFLRNRNQVLHGNCTDLKDGDVLEIGDFEVWVTIKKRTSIHSTEHPTITPFGGDGSIHFEEPMSHNRNNSYEFIGVGSKSSINEASDPSIIGRNTEGGLLSTDNLSWEELFGKKAVDYNLIPEISEKDQIGPFQADQPSHSEDGKQPFDSDSNHHLPKSVTAVDVIGSFLEGAGLNTDEILNDETNLPELMRSLGEVFREMVYGLWTVLRGRMEQKSGIGLAITVIRSSNNNFFKFSPTSEDALKHIILQKTPGFINATEAAKECFKDLMNDQIANYAGVQAAMQQALDRFDPRHFSESQSKVLSFRKNAQNWKDYESSYRKLCNEVVDTFFGEAYKRAYEKQIEQLRTHRQDDREREKREDNV